MAKKKNQTEFAYPVDKIHGKISKNSRIIHSCTANGAQITYLQGERDLNAHPVTSAELARRDLFKRRQAAVSVRFAKSSATYADDMAAYRAARLAATTAADKQATSTFRAYIWSLIKAEIAE